jgi:DNA repair exonuclease SbcCD ATPase subunit
MSLVRVTTEIYKPVFNENEDHFVDKCPYVKHERNRVHYQCRCKAGSYITSRQEYLQHIKSKTHKTFIENYSAYYKEVDDAEDTNKKLTKDNEIMKRKLEIREKEIEKLKEKYNKAEKIHKKENDKLLEDNNTVKGQLEKIINGFDGVCTIINSF